MTYLKLFAEMKQMGVRRVYMTPDGVYELRCEFASMADVAFVPGVPFAGHYPHYVGGFDGIEIMCTEPFSPVRADK